MLLDEAQRGVCVREEEDYKLSPANKSDRSWQSLSNWRCPTLRFKVFVRYRLCSLKSLVMKHCLG